MKINIEEKFSISSISITKATNVKNTNLLAYATVRFDGGQDCYFILSGFTVWISKFGGLNVEVAKNGNFKFHIFEKSLLEKLKKEIIKQYEFSAIPIIEEGG